MNLVSYLCDPEKNTECPKVNCFINGGDCNKTGNTAFAKQPIEKIFLHFFFNEEGTDEQGSQ